MTSWLPPRHSGCPSVCLPEAMTAHLGVDAGNTKTMAMLCRPSGELLGLGRSGCGDIYGGPGEDTAVDEVFAAIDAALGAAGLDRDAVASAAFRLAGVDWPADRDLWDTTLKQRWPQLQVRSIRNDGYAAIRCGAPDGVGVAVAAGTSAAIAARGADGRTWDMGWWGQHPMGGLGLVTEALRAVYLADLGLAPPTALTGRLLAHYGRDNLAELCEWFTRRHDRASHAERVSAAPVVTAAAAEGDPVASDIVDEQGRRLGLYAEVAARRVGLLDRGDLVPVVFTGSVLTSAGSPVAAALRRHLPRLLPASAPRLSPLPPVAGAALDAIAEAGQPVDEATLQQLEADFARIAFGDPRATLGGT